MDNTKLATKALRTQHWAEIIHDCKKEIDFVELPVSDEKNNQFTAFDTEAIVTIGKVDIRINSHTSKNGVCDLYRQ